MHGGRLASRYTLQRPLGRGGMGVVWLATDEMLHRDVAVKELLLPEGLEPAQRAEAVARAVREAQATAQLRHPGIVTLHDVLVEDGRPWIIMELLRGAPLKGPMPPERVARIGSHVVEALSFAHARGIQHRDVKPDNVFLTEAGRTVLTDFGIATQEGQGTLTEAGLLVGSPGFIAPERLAGGQGGPASDLWSLGATLYAAAEGTPAYDGSPTERIRATMSEDPRPPRNAGALGPVLLWMMARDPAHRPDADTALRLLREVADGRPVDSTTLPSGRLPRGPRRRGLLWGLAAAGVAVAATAGVLVFQSRAPGDLVFSVPVNFCDLFEPAEVGQAMRMSTPPKGKADQGGCEWTQPRTGLSILPHHDSDTPDPWSMTPTSAALLLDGLNRENAKGYEGIEWTWDEIGVTKSQAGNQTPARAVSGFDGGAFGFDRSSKAGRVHTSDVYFRVGNLVVQVEYTTLADQPTDSDIRAVALDAARMAQAGLRTRGGS
ncbi:serine/threonine protein kinase [Streptosporangiaceae bacterium NEAU-GS5]|nr:serine/threonine protein kinase [Streptosporangiaceae bacterium NEAU-GS5]